VSLWRAAALAWGLGLACAAPTQVDNLNARSPGDRCFEICPEGMTCRGTQIARGGHWRHPGACDLDPGRCVSDADCRRSERCFRPSPETGRCTAAPQL
jgi:hypothetical protein